VLHIESEDLTDTEDLDLDDIEDQKLDEGVEIVSDEEAARSIFDELKGLKSFSTVLMK
jgi:hypothetical protein